MTMVGIIKKNYYNEKTVIANKLESNVSSHKQYEAESAELGAPNTVSKIQQKMMDKNMVKSKVSGLAPLQLEIVQKLDAKFENIMKDVEANPSQLGNNERTHGLLIFYTRILQVYNVLFNKYITNDDFLLFRIENILKYKYGEDIL